MTPISTPNKVAPLILAAFLSPATAPAANPSAVVLTPPPLAEPLYVYRCDDPPACKAQVQLESNGYVTNVPSWPSAKPTSPATWIFLDTGGTAKSYVFWQPTGDQWNRCVLNLDAAGTVAADSTCVGAVKIDESSSADVSAINLSAAMFPQPHSQEPPSPRAYNLMAPRTLSFVNESKIPSLCLQTDSDFTHTLCSGEHTHLITTDDAYVRTIPRNGDLSKAAQIIGEKYTAKGSWFNSGRDTTGQVYATNLEWNSFPTESSDTATPAGYTDHSLGPTTIDISFVNGFNIGAKLTADQDTVCAISDYEGGPLVFKLFKSGATMGEFPENNSLQDICPTDFQVQRRRLIQGCYSQCSWAHATSQGADSIARNCCSGDHDTYQTCNDVIDKAFIDAITNYSTNVYSWAYDDFRGTFTCDGSASFTFQITSGFFPAIFAN